MLFVMFIRWVADRGGDGDGDGDGDGEREEGELCLDERPCCVLGRRRWWDWDWCWVLILELDEVE